MTRSQKRTAGVLLRALALGLSSATVALFLTATDDDQVDFRKSAELVYAFSASVTAAAYCLLQIVFYIVVSVARTKPWSYRFVLPFSFACEQVLAYALISSAAASIVVLIQIRDLIKAFGLNSDRKLVATLHRLMIGVGLEFGAFAMLGVLVFLY